MSRVELKQGQRDLIFGYIHEYENNWEDLSITEAILFIIAVYYIDNAEFDLSHKFLRPKQPFQFTLSTSNMTDRQTKL